MIKTILVEDEPQSRDFIKKLAQDLTPFIEIIDEASHVEQAIALIKNTRPQLVIVDIQLFGRSAFDIFKETAGFDFKLVFITAFEHFAIPAIKLSAIDYLLKPISPVEFKAAMQKVANAVGQTNPVQKETTGGVPSKNEKLVVSDYKEMTLLQYSDIVYLKADGNYTCLVLDTGKKIVSSKPLAEYESLLTKAGFYRVHKSYLVNISHVSKYIKGRGGEAVMTNGDTVYISSRKKNEFLTLIK